MKDKDKARFIVKIFLCANKGKWYTSKELVDFINTNSLGVKWGISSLGLSRLLTGSWLQSQGIKRQRKNKKNVYYYAVLN